MAEPPDAERGSPGLGDAASPGLPKHGIAEEGEPQAAPPETEAALQEETRADVDSQAAPPAVVEPPQPADAAVRHTEVKPQAGLAPGESREEATSEAAKAAKSEATEMGAASTCAPSTLSVPSVSVPDQKLAPLLKVSPPTPVGRVAGRYMVRLWRASRAMPFGMAFVAGSDASSVVVAEDAAHLGLRKGDELISVNGKPVESVRKCGEVLGNVHDLELLLYHRESGSQGGEVQVVCGSSCVEPYDVPAWCDMCFSPPEPRCRAQSFPLRDVLLTTGPVPVEGDQQGLFSIQISRMSRKQTFGLAFSPSELGLQEAAGTLDASLSPLHSGRRLAAKPLTPGANAPPMSDVVRKYVPPASEDENRALLGDDGRSLDTESVAPSLAAFAAGGPFNFDDLEKLSLGTNRTLDINPPPGELLAVSRDLKHLGLHEGDQLLRINGTPIHSLDACKAVLKGSMTVTLELLRPSGVFPRKEHLSEAGSEDLPCVTVTMRSSDAASTSRMGDLLSWLGIPGLCCGTDTGVLDERIPHNYDITTEATRHSLDVSRDDKGGWDFATHATHPV